MLYMDKLTIVWNTTNQNHWEKDWVEYLFRDVSHTTVENKDKKLFIDRCVIIDAVCWSPEHNDYAKEMSRRGYKFGFYHLSDETTKDSTESYQYCQFVLRNYFRTGLSGNVVHVPLGYNVGFAPVRRANRSAARRRYSWSFVGNRWDRHRDEMLAALGNLPGGKCHRVTAGVAPLTPRQMAKVYEKSVFVACPTGALSIDSFRVTEAFESGCIPIVEKSDYWTLLYGEEFPALQIENWHEASTIVAHMFRDFRRVESLRLECYTWWLYTKQKFTNKVTRLCEGLLK